MDRRNYAQRIVKRDESEDKKPKVIVSYACPETLPSFVNTFGLYSTTTVPHDLPPVFSSYSSIPHNLKIQLLNKYILDDESIAEVATMTQEELDEKTDSIMTIVNYLHGSALAEQLGLRTTNIQTASPMMYNTSTETLRNVPEKFFSGSDSCVRIAPSTFVRNPMFMGRNSSVAQKPINCLRNTSSLSGFETKTSGAPCSPKTTVETPSIATNIVKTYSAVNRNIISTVTNPKSVFNSPVRPQNFTVTNDNPANRRKMSQSLKPQLLRQYPPLLKSSVSERKPSSLVATDKKSADGNATDGLSKFSPTSKAKMKLLCERIKQKPDKTNYKSSAKITSANRGKRRKLSFDELNVCRSSPNILSINQLKNDDLKCRASYSDSALSDESPSNWKNDLPEANSYMNLTFEKTVVSNELEGVCDKSRTAVVNHDQLDDIQAVVEEMLRDDASKNLNDYKNCVFSADTNYYQKETKNEKKVNETIGGTYLKQIYEPMETHDKRETDENQVETSDEKMDAQKKRESNQNELAAETIGGVCLKLIDDAQNKKETDLNEVVAETVDGVCLKAVDKTLEAQNNRGTGCNEEAAAQTIAGACLKNSDPVKITQSNKMYHTKPLDFPDINISRNAEHISVKTKENGCAMVRESSNYETTQRKKTDDDCVKKENLTITENREKIVNKSTNNDYKTNVNCDEEEQKLTCDFCWNNFDFKNKKKYYMDLIGVTGFEYIIRKTKTEQESKNSYPPPIKNKSVSTKTETKEIEEKMTAKKTPPHQTETVAQHSTATPQNYGQEVDRNHPLIVHEYLPIPPQTIVKVPEKPIVILQQKKYEGSFTKTSLSPKHLKMLRRHPSKLTEENQTEVLNKTAESAMEKSSGLDKQIPQVENFEHHEWGTSEPVFFRETESKTNENQGTHNNTNSPDEEIIEHVLVNVETKSRENILASPKLKRMKIDENSHIQDSTKCVSAEMFSPKTSLNLKQNESEETEKQMAVDSPTVRVHKKIYQSRLSKREINDITNTVASINLPIDDGNFRYLLRSKIFKSNNSPTVLRKKLYQNLSKYEINYIAETVVSINLPIIDGGNFRYLLRSKIFKSKESSKIINYGDHTYNKHSQNRTLNQTVEDLKTSDCVRDASIEKNVDYPNTSDNKKEQGIDTPDQTVAKCGRKFGFRRGLSQSLSFSKNTRYRLRTFDESRNLPENLKDLSSSSDNQNIGEVVQTKVSDNQSKSLPVDSKNIGEDNRLPYVNRRRSGHNKRAFPKFSNDKNSFNLGKK